MGRELGLPLGASAVAGELARLAAVVVWSAGAIGILLGWVRIDSPDKQALWLGVSGLVAGLLATRARQ